MKAVVEGAEKTGFDNARHAADTIPPPWEEVEEEDDDFDE